MRIQLVVTNVLARTCDCIHAILLALYAFLIVGPLGFLRGPLMLERMLWYVRVFIPLGILSKAIRVAIDWRLGHFDIAIAQAEEVISLIEDSYRQNPHSQICRRVLGDLYTILARAYMHAGHIDEAMQVVLRAKKSLGLERLVGLVDLDAKTAHLVRAGLAAGRLLDGGGLATMFVKADGPTMAPSSSASQPFGEEASRQKRCPKDHQHGKSQGATIIPFPSME